MYFNHFGERSELVILILMQGLLDINVRVQISHKPLPYRICHSYSLEVGVLA